MKWIKDLIGLTELEKELALTKQNIDYLRLELFDLKQPRKYEVGDTVEFHSIFCRHKKGVIIGYKTELFFSEPQRYYDIFADGEVFKDISEDAINVQI